MQNAPKDTDTYIASFDGNTRMLLEDIRAIIAAAAPKATEDIKYAMPTFIYHGNLVHFAGYEKHIGFYPAPSGITNFEDELAQYKTSKGAIQFPLDKPLPKTLITKIVKFRVKENEALAAAKAQTKLKK